VNPILYKLCPWCTGIRPAQISRECPTATEWKCLSCEMRWNIRRGEPDTYYVFWPPDIEAAFDNDIKPLDLGTP
jgi:hypothetical protein